MSDRLALVEDAGIERAKAERVASVIFDVIRDNVQHVLKALLPRP